VPRVQARVWPTEDFEAALSYVPVEPVEDDLFAGIADAATGDALATRGSLELAYDGRRVATV
jgi:mycothiol S-conjugate amidase